MHTVAKKQKQAYRRTLPKITKSSKRAYPLRIQPKLTVYHQNDRYEQEADRVADQVMRMPAPQTRPACPCGGWCPRCKKDDTGHNPTNQHANVLQLSDAREASVPPVVQAVLSSSGRPLDPQTQTVMESRFGHDFSHIRLHTDKNAAESARSISARAYTVGSDIVFGRGNYRPGTNEGDRLIAHELTHVLQQRASTPLPQVLQAPVKAVATPSIRIDRNPSIPDFVGIARRLNTAMSGMGTDEAAVFSALRDLRGDPQAGEELKRVYQNLFGRNLQTEIGSELSGADLARALRLLNPTPTATTSTPRVPSLSQMRSEVLSIAKQGNASLAAWPDPASGKIRSYQLTQNFQARFAPTARSSGYAFVQWIKGDLFEDRGRVKAYWPASLGLYGQSDTAPWRFTNWIVDTPDADPRFGSDRGVTVTVPTSNFSDSPAILRRTGTLPPKLTWDVHARMGVYRWGIGVPRFIAGWESQRPTPIREVTWGWKIVVAPNQRTMQLLIR